MQNWPLHLSVHIGQVINITDTNISFTFFHVCITLLPHKIHIRNFLGIILTITYFRMSLDCITRPCNLVVENEGSGVRLLGFKSWLLHFLSSLQQVFTFQYTIISPVKWEFDKLQRIWNWWDKVRTVCKCRGGLLRLVNSLSLIPPL